MILDPGDGFMCFLMGASDGGLLPIAFTRGTEMIKRWRAKVAKRSSLITAVADQGVPRFFLFRHLPRSRSAAWR